VDRAQALSAERVASLIEPQDRRAIPEEIIGRYLKDLAVMDTAADASDQIKKALM
jgi:hypothetical protein